MIFGNQFATESGRSRKLQPWWRGPFVIIKFDEYTKNYTVSMKSRIYWRQRGVFHCLVVKPYHSNNDQRFSGGAHTKPAFILIDDEKEWEVETILDHRTRHGRGQFLVKWKGYPSSKNSWELVEGLENAGELLQAWWTDDMLEEEFPTVFSGYILLYVWNNVFICFQGVTGMGYWSDFGVSFDTQYVLWLSLILMMFYVWFRSIVWYSVCFMIEFDTHDVLCLVFGASFDTQ